MTNIYYIANTGFLVKHGSQKVLIDGIHTKQVDPYHTPSKVTIDKIVKGEPPFDHLDLLLFTHFHWDHLDGEAALQTLKNQPNLKLFSNKQTIEFLRNLPNYNPLLENQLEYGELSVGETSEFFVNDISFSASYLIHDGDEYKDVENYVYVVKFNGISVFHCGDAKASTENYEHLGLDKENITLAMLDFPYMSLTSGRKIINTFINPEQILIMHLPDKVRDTYNWMKTINKVVERYSKDLPPLYLCEDIDTHYEFKNW